ncbi:hypothetical protein OHB01_09705 [Microbispora hainanensis]|jgi:hypothetical protein|uniref:Uncharacterized protein n=1 Tax=Microbispora hainanensis TaxID=568844 RepID=A0ABZ1SK97_9ACTN|nr:MULTISPECIES: hypothetical protein [Microbispora]
MHDDIELTTCGIITTGVEDVPEIRAFNEELERRSAAQTPIWRGRSQESFTNRG